MNIKSAGLFLPLLTLSLSLFFSNFSYATGDSYAHVELVPLAINKNNQILFKTKSHINKMGAATYAGLKFGWLVASAKGVWDEQVHYQMHIDDNFDRYDQFNNEFLNRKNLNNPPISLQRLISAYHFEQATILSPTQGQDQVIWSPKQLCLNDICHSQELEQVTLEGFKSIKQKGKPVSSSFYVADIAVFHNKAGYENEYYPEKNQGAEMAYANKPENSLESTIVDGIVFLENNASSLNPHVFTSKNLGFSLTKPKNWELTQTQTILENIDKISDEGENFKAMLARHPKVRLVSLKKTIESKEDMLPDFKVTLYPIQGLNYSNLNAEIILGMVSTAMGNVLPGYRMIQQPTKVKHSLYDVVMSQINFTDTIAAEGKNATNASKLWVVMLNENNFLLLSGSYRQDNNDDDFKEIQSIFNNMTFKAF